MRAITILGSLAVVLLVGCGGSDAPIREDSDFFRDGVARACFDTGQADLSDCHDRADSMIAPNALPADADSSELFSLGYFQACTYVFPGCDPAKVKEEREQGLAAYEPEEIQQ
jgi:hypothetical protein